MITTEPKIMAGLSEPPAGQYLDLGKDEPMPLDCGTSLGPFRLAYETYGTLNADRSNAILVCHALTGDQFVADTHPVTGKPGWWSLAVGPGKPIDTNRYFVICANVLGGCMGTTGPKEINPQTGQPFGLDFPVITIADMVRAQRLLIDHLGIDKLFCVLGGSMGGMQVLEWAATYPERVYSAIPIATAARHSAQNIAFHEVGRQAIMADPHWAQGRYYETSGNGKPLRGLSVARMAAHITYLSQEALHRKFGRNLQNRPTITYGFEADFQVESYLRHQGSTFVDRFDANSYLYITRAMDYFDLAAEANGRLASAFQDTPVRFCVISFTSDWLFPTYESRQIVRALNAVAANVSFVEVETDKGHDAFLMDEVEFHRVIRRFLDGCAEQRGLNHRTGCTQDPVDSEYPVPAITAASGAEADPERPWDIRIDLKLLADLIEPGARVLDVGCGDGDLLLYLKQHKQVDGRGLELSMNGVYTSVSRGLSVIQGDADTDLDAYPENSFDYIVLSQTLQAMQRPKHCLEQLVRIGHRAIVSFPNFGHWRTRFGLMFRGRMPMTDVLPEVWWETANIHHCTFVDFVDLCDAMGLEIEKSLILSGGGLTQPMRPNSIRANLLGEQGIFVLRRRDFQA